jgi:hypothetical protein
LRPAENIQLARLYQARHLLTLAKAVPGLPERVDVALRLPTGAVNRAIQNLLNGQDESSDRRCHPRPRDEILTHHKRPREQRSSGGGGGGGSGDYPRHTTLMHTNLDPKWMCFDCGGEQICMSGLQEKMPRNCTFDFPRLFISTNCAARHVESSWTRAFLVDRSWLMLIKTTCSKRELAARIHSTLTNTRAPPGFYTGEVDSQGRKWPLHLDKAALTDNEFRMTRCVEGQKVRAVAAHYSTTTRIVLHEGLGAALLCSKILVHLVFHSNKPDRVERRRWRSMTHTHRYPRVSILTVDSTMDVVKQVLDGTKCSAALMPRALWEEIEGQVKRLSPRACASAASLVQMHAWRSCACKHARMAVCKTCVAHLCA